MGLCGSSAVMPDVAGLSREEKIRLIFQHLDADHNGVVTFNEMMATASALNAAEKTAVLHQFELIDRNHDEAIDEGEYVQSMLKAYKVTSDKDFDTWVHDMLMTKAWDESKLKAAGVPVKSASFQGKNAQKYISPERALREQKQRKEKKKRDRALEKLQNVEQWGEKLGYTDDHAHYHAPDLARGGGGGAAGGTKGSGKKRRSSVKPHDHEAATKIQAKMRSNLAKKETFQRREARDTKRQHDAATRIQAKHRGNVGRKQTFDKREARKRD